MSGIFIAALLIYFFVSYSTMEHSNEIRSNMSESTLPIIYVKTENYLINAMHAYTQDMGNKAARDMITVLPEDRKLNLVIQEYNNMVTSINYEIRSLDLSHLIENGKIEEINRVEGNTNITVPIQNLIKKDKEYLLKLTLDTGEKSFNYYTRIVWTDNDYTNKIQQLALSFTAGTFEEGSSKNITQYLETTEIADNSTFAHLNLHNSYNQITWGDSGMKSKGQYYVTIKEYSGVMSEVQVQYETTAIDENNIEHEYTNEDNYIFRYDPSRIYIMNYDRKTNEVFQFAQSSIKNKKLVLGIENQDEINIQKSNNEQYIGFKSNKELYVYDQKNRNMINIFSYRSDAGDIRSNYNEHDIKIISVEDDGNVQFLVYGYINRGKHEGNNGIIYYTYDANKKTVIENFFIGIADSFGKIKEDINRLTYLSTSGMLYLYSKGSVFGVDTSSLEVLTIISGLEDEEFSSSYNNQYIAYQDPEAIDIYHSKKISLMNLENNTTIDITQGTNYIRVFGFNENDLIYGEINAEYADKFTIDHDIPVSAIHIIGPDSKEKTNYVKEGLYFTNVNVNENRIQFNEIEIDAYGKYQSAGSDTIISNKKKETLESNGVATYKDSKFGKIWYIEIKDIGDKKVKIISPESFSLEKASSIELNVEAIQNKTPKFYAYSLGHFIESTRSLYDAYTTIYDDYGYITDENGNIVWNRADKNTIVKIKNATDKMSTIIPLINEIGNIKEYDDFVMINATGIDMNSALYYLNKGYPIIVFINGRENLITAYDQYNVTIYDIAEAIESIVGREDAETLIQNNQRHFIAVIPK